LFDAPIWTSIRIIERAASVAGEEVLLSERVLEAISLEAQLRVHLRKPPIDGNFLVDMTVRAAQAAVKVKPGNIPKIQKSLFKVCHEIVKRRYAAADPDNARHADLIALFMFNFWNSIGLLPMTQAMVITAQLNEDEE
jgi:hypothetical protein